MTVCKEDLGFSNQWDTRYILDFLVKHTWVLVSRINDNKDLHFLPKQPNKRNTTIQILKEAQNGPQTERSPSQILHPTGATISTSEREEKSHFILMSQSGKDKGKCVVG